MGRGRWPGGDPHEVRRGEGSEFREGTLPKYGESKKKAVGEKTENPARRHLGNR